MLKKEKKQLSGNDFIIPITIDNDNNLFGYQQEIDKITHESAYNNLNTDKDRELKRISLDSIRTLATYFYSGGSYNNDFKYAGFTDYDINYHTSPFIYSYYKLSFYDSYDSNNQNHIADNYLHLFDSNYALFHIKEHNPLYDLFLPKYYLDSYTGDTITGYTKLTFYNAKSGSTKLFLVLPNTGETSELKYYYTIIIDKTNLTWSVLEFGTSPVAHFSFYEDYESVTYIKKLSNKDNLKNEKPVYPTGSTFDYNFGKYIKNIK